VNKKISGQCILPSKVSTPLGSGGCYGKLKVKYNQYPITGVNIYIGNDGSGSVSPETGYQLEPFESITFDYVELLSDIYLYSAYEASATIPDEYEKYIVSWIILGDSKEF
jgi:hypothetical protein